MMGHLSPNHLNNDLQKVRILNVSGFGMVGFQIPTVIQKAQKLGLSKKTHPPGPLSRPVTRTRPSSWLPQWSERHLGITVRLSLWLRCNTT